MLVLVLAREFSFASLDAVCKIYVTYFKLAVRFRHIFNLTLLNVRDKNLGSQGTLALCVWMLLIQIVELA